MRVAVIPARGGSKRIPRKNIRPFLGKPIIAYSIEAALSSECFDKVIISTDDKEIAEVAENFGAEVPFIRPPELSGDYAATVPVIKHAIQMLEQSESDISEVCCIYATAPFLDAEIIRMALNKLISSDYAYVFTAAEFPYPIQRALTLDSDGRVSMVDPSAHLTRSQDLQMCFHDAGQLYWGRRESFLEEIPMFSKKSSTILLPRYQVQDIDTEEDWVKAEQLFQL